MKPSNDVSEPQERSLAQNAAWAVGGNLFYTAGRFLIVIILTNYFASEQVGRVLYALAVVTPLSFLINMELRTVLVTDTRGWVEAGHCLALRGLSNLILGFCLLVLCLGGWSGWDGQMKVLILLVGAVRMAESWSDVYLGVLQKYERMKNWAISQGSKTVLVLLWSLAVAQLTDQIGWLLVGWSSITVLVLWLYDRRMAGMWTKLGWDWDGRKIKRLGRLAFPLGVFVALAILNQQVAQYFIRPTLGDAEVAYYGAMMNFVTGITAVQNGVNQSVLGRLARYFSGSLKAFWRLLGKIMAISSLAMLGLLAAIWWQGEGILRLFYPDEYADYLYGIDYAGQAPLFLVVMGAGGLIALAMTLGDAILACHRFKSRLAAVGVGLAVNILVCGCFMGRWGLAAAAWAAAASAAVTSGVCAGVLAGATLRKRR